MKPRTLSRMQQRKMLRSWKRLRSRPVKIQLPNLRARIRTALILLSTPIRLQLSRSPKRRNQDGKHTE